MAVIASSWVCWLIIALSFLCYERIINQLLSYTYMKSQQTFCVQTYLSSQVLINVLITVLPLLGLLGTIMGLLQCFVGMAQQDTQPVNFSDGVSVALVSTQLALLCVLPAFFLNSLLVARVQRSTFEKEADYAN